MSTHQTLACLPFNLYPAMAQSFIKKTPYTAQADLSSDDTHVDDTQDHVVSNASDMLSKRFGGINLYVLALMSLAAAVVWNAIAIAEQVQQHHQSYATLQDLKDEHRQLKIEEQRLVIEQQTFSATPQIASRAITQMGMYSPTNEDKLILHPDAAPADNQTTTFRSESDGFDNGAGQTRGDLIASQESL